MKEILLQSGILILVLAGLRWVFKGKINLRLQYALWGLVALRLLVPVQLGSLSFSAASLSAQMEAALPEPVRQVAQQPIAGPSRQTVYEQVVEEYTQQGILSESQTPAEQAQAEAQITLEVERRITAPTLGQVATSIWLSGIGIMALWFLAVNLRFRRRARCGAKLLDAPDCPIPVYLSETVESPCLVGLFRSRIYVTPACTADPASLRHVLAHELTHRRHLDSLWTLVRCLCLCIYWFNPLVWWAAVLSRRDCELACDEGAIERLGEQERLAYGRTLIGVVAGHASPGSLLRTSTTMSASPKQLRERIQRIAVRPKMLAVTAVCLVLVIALAVGCAFAGRKEETAEEASTEPVTEPADPTQPSTVPPTEPSTVPTTEQPSEPVTGPAVETVTGSGVLEPFEPILEGTPMTQEDLESLQENYFTMRYAENSGTLLNPDSFWNLMALTHAYGAPEEVNLSQLFYSGYLQQRRELTEAEFREFAAEVDGEYRVMPNVYPITPEQMDEVLETYFGLTLEQTEKRGLWRLSWEALPGCYYRTCTDSNMRQFLPYSGFYQPDGTIAVFYSTGQTYYWEEPDNQEGLAPDWLVVLRPRAGGGYQFVSNQPCSQRACDQDARCSYHEDDSLPLDTLAIGTRLSLETAFPQPSAERTNFTCGSMVVAGDGIFVVADDGIYYCEKGQWAPVFLRPCLGDLCTDGWVLYALDINHQLWELDLTAGTATVISGALSPHVERIGGITESRLFLVMLNAGSGWGCGQDIWSFDRQTGETALFRKRYDAFQAGGLFAINAHHSDYSAEPGPTELEIYSYRDKLLVSDAAATQVAVSQGQLWYMQTLGEQNDGFQLCRMEGDAVRVLQTYRDCGEQICYGQLIGNSMCWWQSPDGTYLQDLRTGEPYPDKVQALLDDYQYVSATGGDWNGVPYLMAGGTLYRLDPKGPQAVLTLPESRKTFIFGGLAGGWCYYLLDGQYMAVSLG